MYRSTNIYGSFIMLSKDDILKSDDVLRAKEELEDSPTRLFEFQLAAKFGCTVKELLQRIDKDELIEWAAYNMIDPFTEDRADDRSAIIARVVAAGLLDGAYSLNDFRAVMEPVEQMDFETMETILRGTASR